MPAAACSGITPSPPPRRQASATAATISSPSKPWASLRSTLELLLGAEIGSEANRAVLGCRWVHEMSDGREDHGDRFIVLGEFFAQPRFELPESPCQFFVR